MVIDISGSDVAVDVISGSFTGSLIDNIVPTASITNTQVKHIVSLTQQNYDDLTPSADTLYVVGDTSGSVVQGYLRGNVEALSITSNTASIDCKAGNFFTLTLASSADTHLTATNVQAGQTINLQLTQPATTGSVSFNTGVFKFKGGTAPSATTTANAVDVISFLSFDGSTLKGNIINDFS